MTAARDLARLGAALSAVLSCSCAGPSPRAGTADEPSAQDAGARADAGCLDVVALCKAHNVACGALLAHDAECNRDVAVGCGPCAGLSTDRRARIEQPVPFEMGNRLPTAPKTERPTYRVQLQPFAMDRWEVRVSDYAECVAAKVCSPPAGAGACNYGVRGRENHPVNCVDWLQANAYCSFRGARLPTEEEWEYVARNGAGGRLYPWGNQAPSGLDELATTATPGVSLCWSGSSAGALASTCPVGRADVLDRTRDDFEPVGYASAVEDLAGNVREWTVDGASPSYASPRETAFRIVRGGGWFVDVSPSSLSAVRRNAILSASRLPDLGFRCVLPLERLL